MCCGGRGHVHVCRSQRVLVPLELKAVLNCWMRVLGTELWPSVRGEAAAWFLIAEALPQLLTVYVLGCHNRRNK